MSPGIGAPNRGSGIKEDTIVLNRQLGSWELAKCCCLLSLLSGNKAICQTIVGGKLFLIRPLASERPSWRASKTSRHSRKLSVPLKQTWKCLNSGTRRHPSVRLWTQPTRETQSVLRNEKTNTEQLTLHFMVWRAAFVPFTRYTGPSSPKSPPPPDAGLAQRGHLCRARSSAGHTAGRQVFCCQKRALTMKISLSGASVWSPAWYQGTAAGFGQRCWTWWVATVCPLHQITVEIQMQL